MLDVHGLQQVRLALTGKIADDLRARDVVARDRQRDLD